MITADPSADISVRGRGDYKEGGGIAMEKVWHRFYDEDVPFEIDLPKEPLFVQLEKTAREFPQVTATEFVGARLTYQELAYHLWLVHLSFFLF